MLVLWLKLWCLARVLQASNNGFTLALVLCFTCHNMCFMFLFICCTYIVYPFRSKHLSELPCTCLLMLVRSLKCASSWVIWHDASKSPIHMFFVNKKDVSLSIVHIIPASTESNRAVCLVLNFKLLVKLPFFFGSFYGTKGSVIMVKRMKLSISSTAFSVFSFCFSF